VSDPEHCLFARSAGLAIEKLGADLITHLTQAIMSVRRNLLREQPIFAQITAPSTDQDAYLPLHPGAAAVYNSTTQSFVDEYGNWIYLTPMLLGGAATMLAAAWKFLGIGNRATEGPRDSLYALARRIRKVDTEAELSEIEEEIDGILKAERAKSAGGDENAVDDATLNVAAHQLESLIHDRRALLAPVGLSQLHQPLVNLLDHLGPHCQTPTSHRLCIGCLAGADAGEVAVHQIGAHPRSSMP
jgi:hypothetical protein